MGKTHSETRCRSGSFSEPVAYHDWEDELLHRSDFHSNGKWEVWLWYCPNVQINPTPLDPYDPIGERGPHSREHFCCTLEELRKEFLQVNFELKPKSFQELPVSTREHPHHTEFEYFHHNICDDLHVFDRLPKLRSNFVKWPLGEKTAFLTKSALDRPTMPRKRRFSTLRKDTDKYAYNVTGRDMWRRNASLTATNRLVSLRTKEHV